MNRGSPPPYDVCSWKDTIIQVQFNVTDVDNLIVLLKKNNFDIQNNNTKALNENAVFEIDEDKNVKMTVKKDLFFFYYNLVLKFKPSSLD